MRELLFMEMMMNVSGGKARCQADSRRSEFPALPRLARKHLQVR
jgi:hypothetical protein